MTPIEILFAGMVAGAFVIGAVLFCWALLQRIKDFTEQLKSLSDSLEPILKDKEIVKAFRTFTLLAEIGESIGRKMEKIDATIQSFMAKAFVNAAENALREPGAADSAVYTYSEMEAAARDNAARARRQGPAETEESHVAVSPSEVSTEAPEVF